MKSYIWIVTFTLICEGFNDETRIKSEMCVLLPTDNKSKQGRNIIGLFFHL